MNIKFEITHPGDSSAGIHSYSETVNISVESGDPGGEDGDFLQFMRECLSDWFDGAAVENAQTKER